MAPAQLNSAPQAARRPARDLIDAVVDNMRQNLEPLKYSTLAPSRFTIYLHPAEFARLGGLIPILEEQTVRALADELDRLNQRSSSRRWLARLRRDDRPQIDNAGGDWQVEFRADPDGELNQGDLLIDSEIVLPARPDLGSWRADPPHHHDTHRAAHDNQEADLDSRPTGVSGAGICACPLRRHLGPARSRSDQGLGDDRARRHRLPGGHPHRLLG